MKYASLVTSGWGSVRARTWRVVTLGLLTLGFTMGLEAAELKTETLTAWLRYVELTEQRIESELGSSSPFLARDFVSDGGSRARVSDGKVYIEKLRTETVEGKKVRIPKGMVHHWLGAVRIDGVRVEEVVAWLQETSNFEEWIEEVEGGKTLSRDGDHLRVYLRIKGKRIVTVHYNTEHEIQFTHHGPDRVSSRTVAIRIAQVEDAGTDHEREKPPGNDSGYLWRWHSYWRFLQDGDGVIAECEIISLSRSVPKPFWWLVKTIVGELPKNYLDSTLRSLREGLVASASD